jgi:hypothetical protein
MLHFLKVIRYLVFGEPLSRGPRMVLTFSFLLPLRCVVAAVFIISNAIVTSVAVWNLSIVEGGMRFCESLVGFSHKGTTDHCSAPIAATATATASYLIVIAAMGLLLIFPM